MEALFSAALLFGVILYITRPFWAKTLSPVHGELVEPCKTGCFCTQCGGKNPKGSRFCGQCGKALLTLLIMLVASWAHAQGMPPMNAEASGQTMPHSEMKVGQFEGTLIKNGKPQAGKEIVIQVKQGGQVLLTLPKKTDDKGQFVFKNIFKDPQYSYLLMTEDEGKLYRHGPLQLTEKQDSLKVTFTIKPENAADMNAEPMAPESPRAMPHDKAPDQWQQQQTVSLVLAGLVLALVAYTLGRYQKKK